MKNQFNKKVILIQYLNLIKIQKYINLIWTWTNKSETTHNYLMQKLVRNLLYLEIKLEKIHHCLV